MYPQNVFCICEKRKNSLFWIHCHGKRTYIEQAGVFYEILSRLYVTKKEITIADRVAQYISEHCASDLTLEMLCREFHFSKNHIINIFKKEYQMTPIQYMNGVKLKEVEYLLEITSKSTEEIVYECGFRNYSHFYRLFYRRHHVSPSEWRKQKRLAPRGKVDYFLVVDKC